MKNGIFSKNMIKFKQVRFQVKKALKNYYLHNFVRLLKDKDKDSISRSQIQNYVPSSSFT